MVARTPILDILPKRTGGRKTDRTHRKRGNRAVDKMDTPLNETISMRTGQRNSFVKPITLIKVRTHACVQTRSMLDGEVTIIS